MELKGLKINFLGDSITAGDKTSGVGYRFTELIEKQYGAVCRNYGQGGTRIANNLVFDGQNDYYETRVEAMNGDADVVVIFGGTNDFGHGDAPLGAMSDRTPDTFYGALHSLYRKVIEKYPYATVTVITPLHRTNEDNPKGDGNKKHDVGNLQTYVNIIRQVAQYYSLPVLDLFATSGMQPKVDIIKDTYINDGLHPNDEGHKILADKIAKFIKGL